MIPTGVLETIGNTPLLRLEHLFEGVPFELFAKLEGLNAGGSIKDRSARGILEGALERGEITAESTIVESSSGNMAIGLAQACRVLGLRLICVVDPKVTRQNLAILRAYHAEIDMVTEPDPVTREFLQARLNRVEELLLTLPGAFWPNQYANMDNARAHHQTMGEIDRALEGRVDYLFAAASTCGTLRGCADYIAERGLSTRVVAVDAVGSVIFGGERAKRLIPGHGAAVRSAIYREEMAERCVHVSDLDCVVGCRLLVRREAILAGGSSGAVVSAIARIRHELPPGARCVAILCDRGERYMDTIYSDSWVKEHFGDVEHLWR